MPLFSLKLSVRPLLGKPRGGGGVLPIMDYTKRLNRNCVVHMLRYKSGNKYIVFALKQYICFCFYTGRLRPKGVPFSGWRYIKGELFHELKYRKGLGKLSFRY